jgi:para-aminobenzoate synthetase / 4-amino-4-deoxychorismate lyase
MGLDVSAMEMESRLRGDDDTMGTGVISLAANTPPFVLLDDARAVGAAAARLFVDPIQHLTADSAADIPALLANLRDARARGLHAAGYIAYDAGTGFASAARAPASGAAGIAPVAWFGLFAHIERVDADAVPALLPDPASAWLGAPAPGIARADYDAAIARVLELIRAGDIYQANLTFAATVPLLGNPLAVYARLRRTARAGYGGFIWTGRQAIASLSPELFFGLRGRAVMARPMKGTARRDADPSRDAALAADLASDPKQRAENLMIVDLIRNDLSRLAAPGSVAVPQLFRVESFPTIHQLVSDVTATLPEGADAVDVLAAAFPCGSITGAPKVRAMEVIAEVEAGPRGLYTGSIGFIEAGGDAAFNVAIRTLVFPAAPPLPDASIQATLGLGSGIVADSEAGAEWRECLAKGAFVVAAGGGFDLIETMRFDPVEGILRLDGHFARLKSSAEKFDFVFDRHAARNALQAATFRLKQAARVRLRVSPRGALAVEVSPMPVFADVPVPVRIVPLPVAGDDFRLRHKTSAREFYDDARHDAGAAEVAFVNAEGFVTEGSMTNIFVEREGRLLTPPAELGLLPGVLRAELIARGQAVESHLRSADLADGFFIGNAVRGLVPARLAE